MVAYSAFGSGARIAGVLRRVAVVLAAGYALGAPLAYAQDATWAGATDDWNDPTNWTPNAPPFGPTGTAIFGAAGSTNVIFSQAVTAVGAIQFAAGAQQYAINVCACQELQFTGAGIINNSGQTQQFVNEGFVTFLASSTAGNAAFVNVFGGTLDFRATSSAGQATIDNFDISVVSFHNDATAGSATINNTDGAEVRFRNSSTGGTATINNSSSGLVVFADQSSAASATIVSTDGAIVEFRSQATAGNATITNFGFGTLSFRNQSTAGSAVINSNDFGIVEFWNTSTAGNATITNNSTIGMAFLDRSTAGNATIITKGGASTFFFDRATGGDAQFITEAGGIVDFSGTLGANNDGQVAAGSIHGAGDYIIGVGNTLTVGSNNLSTEVSGIIADTCGCPGGPGSLVKVGTGTLTLSGINTYTGTTTVNAGTLVVNGSIATSSLLTVRAGGTVGGTGFLSATFIDGGTISPGNSVGAINVAGTLQFSSTGVYTVEILGAAADKINVTDTATLAGTVQVVPLSAALQFGTPYTILTANNGTIGQFAGATAPGFTGLSFALSYIGNDVLLTLAPNLAGVNGLNLNQRSVAAGLDRGMTLAGNTAGFDALFLLPPSQIPNALSQLSGEVGTGAAPAGLLSMSQFLALMIDPFAGTRGEDGASGPALGFAADHRASPQAMEAYAALLPVNKAPVSGPQAYTGQWTVWGAAYGSHSRADGDGAIGSHDRTVRTGNIAGGFERRLSPDAVIGVAMSGGSASFRLSDGLGSGRGDIVQGGAYGTWRFHGYYLAASLAASYFDVSSDRSVTLPVASQLAASYGATGLGARIESGRRFIQAGYGVTPFVAVQVNSVRTDAYNERVVGGSPLAALGYNAETTSRLRSEVGATFDGRFAAMLGGALHWYGRVAWAHEYSRENSIVAAFQSLPGSTFSVQGAAPFSNAALLAGGMRWNFANGLSLHGKIEGEFAGNVTTYNANAVLRKTW